MKLVRACLTSLSIALLAACAPQGGDEPTAATAVELPSDPYAPTPEQRAEIVGLVQQLFDGLAGDVELIRDALDPEIRMVFTETAAEGTKLSGTSSLQAIIERVESAEETMIERMWDPEVRVHGDIATVWTPYDFYVGERLSHCGIDVVTLMHREDGWKIVGLEWSRAQPPACALHPDGPPHG